MIAELLLASSAPFDVDSATRAYLDTIQGAARARSDAYVNSGYWVGAMSTAIFLLCDWLILRLRIASAFRTAAERWFRRPSAVTWLTALLYIVASWIMTLPLFIYIDFWRSHQFGFSDGTLVDWLGDRVMMLVVMAVLAPLLLVMAYAIIRRSPRNWWIWASAAAAPVMLAIMVLAPVFIQPLFATGTEMQPGPLRTKIEAMAAHYDIPSTHIYVNDPSRHEGRISASVSGLGPTVRLTVSKDLLHRTSDEEVQAVMGHEIGHYVLNHVWWTFGWNFALFAACFFLVSRLAPWVIARWGGQWGVRNLADPASIPLISLCLSGLLFVSAPLITTISRTAESQADAFGLDLARQPDGLARVAMRVGEYRKVDPGAVEEFLFAPMPSAGTRVRMAMEWKARHIKNPRIVVPPKGYLDAR